MSESEELVRKPEEFEDNETKLSAIYTLLSEALDGGDVREAAMKALEICDAPLQSTPLQLSLRQVLDLPKEYFVASVASSTDSGKSVLVRALVEDLVVCGRADNILVFSGNTIGAHKAYAEMGGHDSVKGKDRLTIYEFSEDTLREFLDHQKNRMVKKRYVVILDDVLGTDADKSLAVRSLVSDGRHLNIITFVCVFLWRGYHRPTFFFLPSLLPHTTGFHKLRIVP